MNQNKKLLLETLGHLSGDTPKVDLAIQSFHKYLVAKQSEKINELYAPKLMENGAKNTKQQ